MTFLSMIYTLLIGPLELFFDVIYTLAYRVVGNPGLSIIFLSLAMNFLVLPLYQKADELQSEERELEAKLQPWVSHIKKAFKGDEQYMMLQTFYRQNNYKPTDALKGSISLFLEIPFFIAAYNFLSNLKVLQGVSFGPIKDLGEPDGLIIISGIAINLLPVLMTGINLVSSMIYSKGMSLKNKIQMYGIAVIFLVLLYQSPSGLVFYWTLNNVFSLLKNVFYKIKNPKRTLCLLASGVGICLFVLVLFVYPMETMRRQIWVLALISMLQLPLILYSKNKGAAAAQTKITVEDKKIFYIGCVFLTVFLGVLIPTAVIQSSPDEFVNVETFKTPLWYVFNSFLLSAGTLIIWLNVFYMLVSEKTKALFSKGVWCASCIALVNYMFFGRDLGNLSNTLKFDEQPTFALLDQLVNVAVVLGVILIAYLFYSNKKILLKTMYSAAVVAVVLMSAINIKDISSTLEKTEENIKKASQDIAQLPLSKNGKNVIVIMLDRAINSYVPFIFNEKPELLEQFEGFTYYPNTVSFGSTTNIAAPALFGGYEYTPTQLNLRETESLAEKHNEALLVMPVLFSENGFKTTVCDPPYAGYTWIPDLSIYDKYPDINAYITQGKFNENRESATEDNDDVLNRNFLCYSVFKSAPLFCQTILYNNGLYNSADAIVGEEENVKPTGEFTSPQATDGLSKSTGVNSSFMEKYYVLNALSAITDVSDEKQNTFLMITNDSTHEPMILQEPNYTPAQVVDNSKYDAENGLCRYDADGRVIKFENVTQVESYHANMAALLKLGAWFDYLKETGVYDNTRIIIVADHGRSLSLFSDMKVQGDDFALDAMSYNPLLLVKDFGSTYELKTDDTFMTNADVPALTTKGIIDKPINPFTDKPLNFGDKNSEPQKILASDKWQVSENNGNKFLPGNWYSVHSNIIDDENWSKVGTY